MSQPFGESSDFNNPFAPPPSLQSEAPQRPPTKPGMATVFGILNLVFGGLSLLTQAFGLATILLFREKLEELTKQSIPAPGALQWVGTAITLLLTCWLIYSGIRVLSGTMAGRGAFMAYCLGSLLIRPGVIAIGLFAQFDQMQQQMAQLPGGAAGAQQGAVMIGMIVGGVFGLLFAEAYEAVGFFVMRSKNVTQQFEAWDKVVNRQNSNQTFDFN
jgi:hypothetical protein